ARDRVSINVPDCYADPGFNPEIDRRTGFRTRCSLTLPLTDHDQRLVGVMQVLNKAGGPFDAADQALAEALAAQCAVALARVRMTEAILANERMRHELEIASQVQRNTLPQTLPQVAGYDMHAVFKPALQTGGDTYDLTLVSRDLLVVLADASGHGIGPALLVTQMQAMLRMALRLGATLETAFRQVNDQLALTLRDGHFVNAFVGLLDASAHRLRFLSGGQGPILHWQAARNECTAYRATSFPMGAMAIVALRPAVELRFEPGDWLLLLSDGLYEYENAAGRPFGRARVEEALRAAHHGTPAALAEQLMQAVHAHAAGAAQEDDITLVLLKRSGMARSGHTGAAE
ncbi:MAG: SpoIIE family protein phosphatase, partial [Chitinophagaceae bacterium]|nr:SpoIIE family protein phosphatase [Rubrivivax sp.]